MALNSAALRSIQPKDKPYKLFDAEGLFLLVHPNGSTYWRFRYRMHGREKLLAFGVYPSVPLALAREKRNDARKLIKQGIDPSAQKQTEKQQVKEARENTFEILFEEWWQNRQTKKLDPKSEKRTRRLFDEDVLPVLGSVPIADVTADHLMTALNRLKARGAIHSIGRLRQKISEVYRFAIAKGRVQVNLADAIKDALPTAQASHHSALTNPKDVGRLMLAIDNYPSTPIVKAALKLSAWWFLRPGELRHCKWSEINWDECRLEIPGERMKTGDAHIVPICTQALELLEELKANHKNGDFILPSPRSNQRPISENAVRVALRSMGYTNEQMTAHGFRAMARTLLDEVLEVPVQYIEAQLAHVVRDPLGRAYNRTKHIKQRAEMMQAWADYLEKLGMELRCD